MSNNKKSEKKAGTKMRSSKNFKISTRIMLTAILGILIPIFLIGAFSPVLIYFTGSYFNISSVTTNYYSTINQIQWAQTISSISNALLSEGEDKEKLDGLNEFVSPIEKLGSSIYIEKNGKPFYSSSKSDILEEANITDSRYPVKGMAIWMPYGFQIRKYTLELLKELLDKDNEEVLFPMLIPETELAKEGEHVKGFEDEVYWVTKGGQKDLNEQLALRPTSETAIYPMYSLWIRSHIDLPIKYYQIVNTFRYETKHTRPLIRVREISTFKEAHTAHATKQEAKEQVDEYIELYKEFFNDLGIPYLISDRPSWDKFPGADYTMAFDTIMPDGKTLQIGTIHNLGQTFAKTFDITFEDKDGEHKYVYQTCAGLSDRVIAAMIANHGDEKGLRLPSMVAPTQVTIIPILFKKGREEVLSKCMEIKESLESAGLRVKIDDRDIRPGKKFYDWELKGTPIKIELGPRDLENNITIAMRRDKLEKVELPLDDSLANNVLDLIEKYDEDLKTTSWKFLEDHVIFTTDLDEIQELIESGNVVSFNWCGDDECGKEIEEKTGYDILGIYEELDGESGIKCINNDQEEAKYIALIAKTY